MALSASPPIGARLHAWLMLALAMTTTGCTERQMQPAQAAIAEIEATLAVAGTASIKYIPGEVGDVRGSLADLKQMYEREDYAGVLRDAPAVLAAAQALPQQAATREAELQRSLQEQWAALESAVPPAIEAARMRADQLAATAGSPDGVPQQERASAARRLGDAHALWERALAERNAQRLPEAVTLGLQARELLDRATAESGLGAPRGPVK